MEAVEVIDADGQPAKIVKLRNNWGKIEWKGDWSDYSEKWTPDLVTSIKKNKKETDNAFWMSI